MRRRSAAINDPLSDLSSVGGKRMKRFGYAYGSTRSGVDLKSYLVI
jgi:hypothetical protein